MARDRAQYDNFQNAKELKLKIDDLEQELAPFSPFINAEEKIKQLDSIKNKLDTLTPQRCDLQNDLKALERQKPALWTLVSGIVLIAGGLIGLIANPYLWVAAIAGLFFSVYWLITWRVWKRQARLVAQKVDKVGEELRKNNEEAERLLTEFGCRDYDAYYGCLAEYRTKIEAKRDAVNKLDALIAENDWGKFVEVNADLDIQMSANLKELKKLEAFRLEPVSLQKLEDEVNGLLKRRVELEQEKGALEKFFEYTEADKDQLTDTEEALKELEQDKEFWERKRKVYDITREIIEEAHKQTLSKAADLLEVEISRYMTIITENRYNQVKVNESERGLSIRTFSPEKNDWVDVLDLSRATQDQFYICARLALVKLITEGKRLPILLDDPFVNFHPKRLTKTVLLLQEIAKENQILLFTCSDAYDYVGKVISID